MSKKRTTVLIVEDERDLADLYAEWLKSAGYRTHTAYRGATALEAADEAVDVALLDRRLPEMQGEEVLDRIRERGLGCAVAMVTAVEPEADIVEMGFDEYAVKPVGESELTALVDELATDHPPVVDAPVLDALGDAKARRCLHELQSEPMSAKELAGATGYSRTTVYRRLNTLRQAGLVASRTTIDPDGDHYETYSAESDRILVEFVDGGIEVDPAEEPVP